ncbi:RNA annealing protein YRA1 [Nakaseomyces bracarensis]|uniref:RNA annealing protein YRA1 n=1 Tax=Nakaseomyces bracarensis TaxID=273131 RepID=A0ABR4NSV7_9SACH
MANVTFRNGDLAKKAVAQFSGAPIDGGKSRLRLNIVVDPSVQLQPARPLSERIRAVSRGKPNVRSNVKAQPQQVKAKGPSKKAAMAKAARKQKPKKERQPKKNLEDLDKEMADYFGESTNAN